MDGNGSDKNAEGKLVFSRSVLGLMGMVVLVGMGEHMAERFLPIYLLALGGGALSVGVLNGLDNLLSALYSFPGGYLADRLGTKRALLVFNLLAMAGFLVVIIVPKWQAVIGASFLFLSWTAISLPATMKLIARALPKNKRTMGVSVHSLVRRVPMALGPLFGGAMIGLFGEVWGVRVAFGGAFLLAFVALVAQQVLIDQDDAVIEHAEKNPFVIFRLMSPDLKNLLVSDILIRFCEQIPYAFAVVWAMKVIPEPVSAWRFGVLTAIGEGGHQGDGDEGTGLLGIHVRNSWGCVEHAQGRPAAPCSTAMICAQG